MDQSHFTYQANGISSIFDKCPETDSEIHGQTNFLEARAEILEKVSWIFWEI